MTNDTDRYNLGLEDLKEQVWRRQESPLWASTELMMRLKHPVFHRDGRVSVNGVHFGKWEHTKAGWQLWHEDGADGGLFRTRFKMSDHIYRMIRNGAVVQVHKAAEA